MVHVLAVGDRWPAWGPGTPEGTQYNYYDRGHELAIFVDKPTRDEINAVRKGQVEIRVLVDLPVVLLLARFAGVRGKTGLPWQDAPYSWHLVPEERRQLPPELGAEERPLLTVVLVDARDGKVRALRQLALEVDVGQALHAGIRAQAAAPWPGLAYDAKLESLFASSSEELARRAR